MSAQGHGLWWCTALVLMRSLAVPLLVPVLATLLVLTTPVGTGQGVHANELLHPLLPHVHLMGGRIVSDEQVAAARAAATADAVTSQPTRGPALGAGNGADAAGLGMTLGPAPPLVDLSLPTSVQGRLPVPLSAVPAEFRDPPRDPPPDQLA